MFFLDSSEEKEIRDIFAWGVVAGVTTNPLILAREAGAADLEQRIRGVVAASHGPVSVELTTETEASMLEEARTFNQAYLAALAGGTYVSIFSGRVRDMGYDVRPVIAQTREQIDREGLAAKIIIGSIRHFMDVNESLEAGAHIVTVPPAIRRKMLHNPKTDETIREFNTAWANRGK